MTALQVSLGQRRPSIRAAVRRHVAALAFLMLALFGASPAAFAALDSKGTEFWLMFNENLSSPSLTLFITGDTATTGTVTVPGTGFTAPFTVVPGTVTAVPLPSTTQATGTDTIENKGIHVVALAEVTVYGLNRVTATTDAYLGLPVDILGTSYINLGYANVNIVNATQLGIVATQNATTVTITPTVPSGSSRTAGVPYTITLNQGQTYQLRSTQPAPADLSGTIISSNKPIGVFGGHQCANIPSGSVACDHIVEMLPSTDTWGRAFVTVPLATRTRGDTFRILAGTNGTTVTINGVVAGTINRGQFLERVLTVASTINTSQPVLVAQYSNSSSFDGVTSDPFEMLVPPFEQFLASYTVTTPNDSGLPVNFINIAIPTSVTSSFRLDGNPVPAGSFTPIAGSTFSGAKLSVAQGSHTLAASLPFGAFVYGFGSFDSYGYPGGQSLSQVATVTTLVLAPRTATVPVGTSQCTTGTVSDQNGNRVAGVRVDFNVTGVNPNVGFAIADATGVAQYCYTGANAGGDTIVGSVGTITDTVTKTWVQNTVARCDIDGNGSIDTVDINLIRAALGQSVGPTDARDADGDGLISMLDVRKCTLRCTRAQCATN